MVFDWLRGKHQSVMEEKRATEHPFDRAARETNDALKSFTETSMDLEAEEERRVAREAMKRIKS